MSESAKRNLGRIGAGIFSEQKMVHLLGTADAPFLELRLPPVEPDDEEISIDEARADWSNVTLAAAIYGTRFCVLARKASPTSSRRNLVLAILRCHPKARHPAERYIRSRSPAADYIAKQIEALAREVRKLGTALT